MSAEREQTTIRLPKELKNEIQHITKSQKKQQFGNKDKNHA